MPDGLYDRDILSWSDRQAALLRRLAAGERLNEAVDWPNVIEEVQDVGLSELRACRSLLRQAMFHLMKLHAWPESRSKAHWIEEAGAFLADAEDCFTASMRQRIDLDALYARALHLALAATDESGDRQSFPATCPFHLDELLARQPDVRALAAKLAQP